MYLPVELAPVLLEQAAHGFVESDLVDGFFKSVSESEPVIFKPRCSDLERVDQEELLEIMDVHNCQRPPTADDNKQILREICSLKIPLPLCSP